MEAFQLAPAKTSQRTVARKIKDRWRAKNWYRVLAPEMFEGVQIGETLSDDPEKIKNRVLDVTLQQLTGDFSKMHVKLLFKIDNVTGTDAYSNFIGHSLTSDYIRRLTRRKRSKMDGIYDVNTLDGFTIRVKSFAVTEKRIQTSQQRSIRMIMSDVIEKEANEKLVSEFIREMLSGELCSKIFKECKPIYPIKRVEIRRSDIIGIPAHGPQMKLPEPKEIEPEPEIATESEVSTELESKSVPEISLPKEVPEQAPVTVIKDEDSTIEEFEEIEDEAKVEVEGETEKKETAAKKRVKKTTEKKVTVKKKKVVKKAE